MPRVAFAGFLLAGTLASVAVAVGAPSKGGWVAKAPALLNRTEVAAPARPRQGRAGGGVPPGPPFFPPAREENRPGREPPPARAPSRAARAPRPPAPPRARFHGRGAG